MILMALVSGYRHGQKKRGAQWRFGNQSQQCEDMRSCEANAVPIGSMYAIYGNIYINIPQMLAYIPYMDPMQLGSEDIRMALPGRALKWPVPERNS